MAEVQILELLQKNDVPGVANVVHMKEHFHFREHVCITFDLMGWVWNTKASYHAHSYRNKTPTIIIDHISTNNNTNVLQISVLDEGIR